MTTFEHEPTVKEEIHSDDEFGEQNELTNHFEFVNVHNIDQSSPGHRHSDITPVKKEPCEQTFSVTEFYRESIKCEEVKVTISDVGPSQPLEKESKKCDSCDYSPPTDLEKDIRVLSGDSGDKPFFCYVCGLTFKTKSNVKSHIMWKHSTKKPFKCTYCDYACKVKCGNLKRHMAKHKREEKSEEPCEESYEATQLLDLQSTAVQTESIRCEESKETIFDVGPSQPLEKESPKRDSCDDSPETDIEKPIKGRSGEKPFLCYVCGLAFKQKSHVRTHMMWKHSTKRPYKCAYCDYASVTRRSVRLHTRRHTDERPYKCTACDYSARSSTALKYHVRQHTIQKEFKCTFCDYATTLDRYLAFHMRIHAEPKNFKCSSCDYATIYKVNLQTHIMRKHTGSRPFKCTICDYASAHVTNLNQHMKRHSDDKPFRCDVCDYACKAKGNLKRHMASHKRKKKSKKRY